MKPISVYLLSVLPGRATTIRATRRRDGPSAGRVAVSLALG